MYVTEPLMYDSEPLVRIVVTMKIVHFFAGYSGYCVNDVLWGMPESNISHILSNIADQYICSEINTYEGLNFISS